MSETKITLATLWTMLMFTYLLGDGLRIFSGDFKASELGGQPFNPTQSMWFGIAVLMLTPIVSRQRSIDILPTVIRPSLGGSLINHLVDERA